MRKKNIAFLLGVIAALTALVFLLVTPFGSPNVPSGLVFSSLDYSFEQNGPIKEAQENPEDAAAASPIRVFACDWQDPSKSEISDRSHQEFFDSQNQKRVEIAESLMQSNDPEHLLAAALVGFDRKSKEHIAAMEKALAADPDNPITLWNFLYACSLNAEETLCQDGGIEKRAVLADGGNGALWGRIAGYRFRRGDTARLIDALIKANAAPQFNRYFIEQVEMLERGYVAASDYSYQERIMNAISIMVGNTSDLIGVYNGCKEQAAESAEWLQPCIEYGKRLERDGRTILAALLGIAIQKEMHEISGDAKKKAETDHRRWLLNDSMNSAIRMDGQVLVLDDEHVLADFIAEWSAHGELRAHQFVHEEVVRLSKQPGYNPCKSIEENSVQTPE